MKISRILIGAEYLIHILIAVILLFATAGIFLLSIRELQEFSLLTILTLISNALLMLIVKEILWTVLRFLKRQDFNISSFLFIGIISSIRQMLFVEAQKSIAEVDVVTYFIELGLNAAVILILMVSYFLWKKAENYSRPYN
ncbi:phosphate-starvation-inducible PsiE family protein [Calderihabitans maritimus]|uniref:Phosphate-starvation-inducible E n=1 Tax=Calderihabitans maritimus TaxID=1246530 RepID=A0A1Z5HP00_9FIRM|nr:phosphate-starvation-inducible PsiE family protein [Calderihabitans maritimus]GAW91107.1 hypothetical protein TherJR_2314 [Calderihabitans maritimus]